MKSFSLRHQLAFVIHSLLITIVVCTSAAVAQDAGMISGRIEDAESGAPLPGANITLEGLPGGTVSNQNGQYRLRRVPAGEQTLVVSFIGYETAEISVSVAAGQAATTNVQLESSVLETGEVVVTGMREGQIRAISQKRQALNTIDVISADEIGKLPEENVAEAVRRLPGVVMQTSRGEGRFVSIRGGEASLNNVTLNGHSLASTAESRATALDLLPASMVSSIEVIKAVTPDMDGNSVGGTINVNTLSAFDRSASFAFGNVTTRHHERVTSFGDRKRPYEANFTTGTAFGPENTFGVVVSGNASRRDYIATIFNPQDWEDINENGIMVPEDHENGIEDNERERFGVNANLDYRPSPAASAYLHAHYSRTHEFDENQEYIFELSEGDLTNQTSTSGRFAAGEGELDIDLDDEIEYLYSFTLGGDYRLGDVQWEAAATHTRGLLDRFNRDMHFDTGDREDFASVYDVSHGGLSIFPEQPLVVKNPRTYLFNSFDRESEYNEENTWVGKVDMKWDLNLGGSEGFVKAGTKLRRRAKLIDDSEVEYGDSETPISLADFSRQPPEPIQNGGQLFVFGNGFAFDDYFLANQNDQNLFVTNPEETRLESVENDSENSEQVYAGYLMGQARLGLLNVVAGARIEHTATASTRHELLYDDDINEQELRSETFETSYSNILPSVHLKYAASSDVVLRGSWSNTIGRPDYEELAGFREFEFFETQDPGIYLGFIEEGNPELKPYKSMNVDLGAEYYVRPGGLLAVSAFYKQIEDPIYGYSFEQRDVTQEGKFFERLGYYQQRNGESGSIRGVELMYQQPFIFLPAPFDGLGISSNVTLADSEVTLENREKELPFFDQSDVTYNIIPYFQKAGFELRTALTYRSEYLDGLEDEAYQDEYGADRLTIDLSASYTFDSRFPGQWKAIAQVRNLTNAPETFYQGTPDLLTERVVTGRTFSIGLSTQF